MRELLEIYEQLAECSDLRPSAHVDTLFGRLVRIVVDTPGPRAAAIAVHPAVRAIEAPLRTLCGAAEYELELHWADRIANSRSPHDELALFPCAANYRQLHRMEITAVAQVANDQSHPIRRVALIGSGPLPLTSVLLATDPGVAVVNVDRDARAVAASKWMAAALGIDGVSFDHEEVHSGTDLSGYDLVVLAALAGSTPREKQSLLSHLAAAMAPGALLLARSARHLRTLLYSPINLDALAGFDVLSVLHPVHPFHEVINSVILARKPRHRLGRRRGTAGAPASAAARHGSSAPGRRRPAAPRTVGRSRPRGSHQGPPPHRPRHH